MIFMFLTCMSNFMIVGLYLQFDPSTYFLCIILDYKILKYKYLIDDIVIDLWFSGNFANIYGRYKKKI